MQEGEGGLTGLTSQKMEEAGGKLTGDPGGFEGGKGPQANCKKEKKKDGDAKGGNGERLKHTYTVVWPVGGRAKGVTSGKVQSFPSKESEWKTRPPMENSRHPKRELVFKENTKEGLLYCERKLEGQWSGRPCPPR